jgi:hypothetical protein
MTTLKSILLLALVFTAGLVIGTVGTRSLERRALRQSLVNPEKMQIAMELRVDRRLQLNNDQQARVHDILAIAHLQLREIRLKSRPEIELVASNANRQISALLNPNQLERYEKLKAESTPILPFLRQQR